MVSVVQAAHALGGWGYLGAVGLGIAVLLILGTLVDLSDRKSLRKDPNYRPIGGGLAPALLLLSCTVSFVSAVLWNYLLNEL